MKALVGRGEGLSLIQILGSSILSTEPLELSDPSVLCGSCHVLAFALLPQLDHKLPKGRGLSYTLGVSLPDVKMYGFGAELISLQSPGINPTLLIAQLRM